MSSHQERSSLTGLAPELLLKIFDNLNSSQLALLSRTSKLLHRYSESQMYKHVALKGFGQLQPLAHSIDADHSRAQSIESFYIGDETSSIDTTHTKQAIERLFELHSFPQLRTIVLDNYGIQESRTCAEVFIDGIVKQPSLEEAALRTSHFNNSDHYWGSEAIQLFRCRNLRKLALHNYFMDCHEIREFLKTSNKRDVPLDLRLWDCGINCGFVDNNLGDFLELCCPLKSFTVYRTEHLYPRHSVYYTAPKKAAYYTQALESAASDLEELTLDDFELWEDEPSDGFPPDNAMHFCTFTSLKYIRISTDAIDTRGSGCKDVGDELKRRLPPNLEVLALDPFDTTFESHHTVLKYFLEYQSELTPHLARIVLHTGDEEAEKTVPQWLQHLVHEKALDLAFSGYLDKGQPETDWLEDFVDYRRLGFYKTGS